MRVVDLLHAQGLYPVSGVCGRVGEGVWTALPWRPRTTLWTWCLPTREGRAAPDTGPRLVVADDGRSASGRFTTPVEFMKIRSQRPERLTSPRACPTGSRAMPRRL
ncbi:hypothetical protein [Embleya scabrispora]|uniref:hypothetical protein n=1 Tax=Embleya scabrispora TaxID=159449 RepID=UPI00037B99FD|nr:hypothetical protein [Embleya scabrispora]MYS84633.1 hypothetical protein [Streptomyces sp. SID5474]